MKIGFKKITLIIVFGLMVAFMSAVAINKVSAQTAQDCNSSSPGFWGWIACYIGSPSQGIGGNVSTLFQGQKAIYERIGTSGGGGNTSGTAGLGVYLEKAGASTYFGQLASEVPNGSTFWGCGSTSGSANIKTCPLNPFDTQGNLWVSAVFNPSESLIGSYALAMSRRGVAVKPTLCYLRQDQKVMLNNVSSQNQGVADVEKVMLVCSYVPNICNSGLDQGQFGCLGKSEITRTIADYTSTVPAPADQYRIRVK